MKKNSRKESVSFERCLRDLADFKWNDNSPEPLAFLDYQKEVEIKNKAFAVFLQRSGVKCLPEELVLSPKSRNYRTTSKRRVFCDRQGLSLGFSKKAKPGQIAKSELEPIEHQNVYEFLGEILASKAYSPLARALNWLVIRGTYNKQFLIFNIFKMDASVVRKLKHITEALKKQNLVDGAMAYFDPTRSEYYLEAERPPRGLQVKHLFGPRFLSLKVDDVVMKYSLVGFSQVNESMVSEMLRLSSELLKPSSDDNLLDLYCGYGLFSHTVGSVCKKVTGVELSRTAIDSAREIAKRLKKRHMSFYSEKINAQLVRDKFEPASQRELVILDPPRKGCESGVISELARRQPKRVLHIFCGTDEIPRELKQWQQNGYNAKNIQPLDMFAGTPNLETLVLLER